jgi:four helix bundle protein
MGDGGCGAEDIDEVRAPTAAHICPVLLIEGLVPDSGNKVRTFRDLRCWQRSVDLAKTCREVAKQLPDSERFALRDQLMRAANSVPSNIAEGNGRPTRRDYIRLLGIAYASLMELESHLYVAQRVYAMTSPQLREALAIAAEVERLLRALLASLRRKT